MNAQLETTIVDRLHQLDERRLSEVLDFVEFLAARRVSGEPSIRRSECRLETDMPLA